MRIGFIITGRMKSTRLPKKLTLKILDKEVIKWMILRAKLVCKNEEIVIATSKNPQDDILEDIAFEMGIKVFRGDEDDVVLRLYEAAMENKFDYFFNITADCPLFGFDYFEKFKDIISNEKPDLITSLDLPHGFFIYALKTASLKRVIEIKRTNNTEVWGDYFYSNPDKFNVVKLEVNEIEKRPDYRLTIDYLEDFQLFEKIFEHFGIDTYKKTSKEILDFLDANIDLAKSNFDCKEKYLQRWEQQIATKLEK